MIKLGTLHQCKKNGDTEEANIEKRVHVEQCPVCFFYAATLSLLLCSMK